MVVYLDMRTMIFVDGVLLLMVTILMFGFALVVRPRRRELGIWCAAYAVLFFGVMLFALRGFIPDLWSVVLGNALILAFYPLLNSGIAVFRGRRPMWKLAAFAVAVAAAWFAWFDLVHPSMPMRFAMYSAFTIGACVGGSVSVARKPDPRLASASRITASVYGCIALLNVVRLCIGSMGLPADILDAATWDALIQTLTGILLTILSFALLFLHAQRANQELASAVSDRELLLREAAHRTKNDLALVDSLISLEQGAFESSCLSDPEVGVARLESLRDKIRCMTLAHDRLAHADRPGSVRLDEYLEAVAAGLPNRAGIVLERDFAAIEVPFSFAAPLGLAMNELATNALKYAYPEGKGGSIRLSLRLDGGRDADRAAILEVRDRGVGATWPPERPGLGTAILEALASKLKGGISYAFEGGSVFRLRFGLPPAPPPRR
jgi:two-component sensor histidine kinase